MPHPYCRRHGPKPDCRRAIELPASCRDGCTDALLVHAHGFTIELLAELIRAGLPTASIERIVASGYAGE